MVVPAFGYAVGDILAVGQLAWNLYRACNKAPEDFRLLSGDLLTVQGHFRLLEEHAKDPTSLLNRRASEKTRASFDRLLANFKSIISDIDGLVAKYHDLGTKVWRRIGFINEDLESLRQRLSFELVSLTTFNISLQTESISRIEASVEEIVLNARRGTSSPSILGAHEESNIEGWHDLSKELASEGFRPVDIERHKEAITLYVRVLLDQESCQDSFNAPQSEIGPDDSASQIGTEEIPLNVPQSELCSDDSVLQLGTEETSLNTSADRNAPLESADSGRSEARSHDRSKYPDTPRTASSLFISLKTSTKRAAAGLGKAGNRVLGRKSWSGDRTLLGSNNGSIVDDETYEPQVIYQPLIEQTRITRIAKRLEDSRDKTEFWIPALPWRCIDYLNHTGLGIENLYWVPGSNKEIKVWEKRFDQEHDINLFDAPDLHNLYVISSLFKRWLINLPDTILPQEVQTRVTATCTSGATPDDPAPQLFKDELSRLPPWNYYLLFAITCHLSLVLAYADKNKITFDNLRLLFSLALKMDGRCLQWLICDWKSCWQGCWTEKDFLEREDRFLDSSDRGQEL